MRRLAASALALLAVGLAGAGDARAVTLRGTAGPDKLVGTAGRDTIFGRGGDDRLDGRGGDDLLDGGLGRDLLLGGPGDDRLAADEDGSRDVVRCGGGRDLVAAELADAVGPSCETVSRQLSRDPFSGGEGQHQTEVEPDSFAVGSTIVTAFQAGRMVDGGASGIGFSTSRDGGAHWRSGFLPALTPESRPPGDAPSASDPAVAYDALHRYWLVATVAEIPPELEELRVRPRTTTRSGSPATTGPRAPSAAAATSRTSTCGRASSVPGSRPTAGPAGRRRS